MLIERKIKNMTLWILGFLSFLISIFYFYLLQLEQVFFFFSKKKRI